MVNWQSIQIFFKGNVSNVLLSKMNYGPWMGGMDHVVFDIHEFIDDPVA